MEKCMTLELGQEIWKMSLEYLVQCEKKKKRSAQKTFQKGSNIPRGISKGSLQEEFPQWPIWEQFENENI